MNNTAQQKPKYLVMDIVFYGGSLNYDQGSNNYQELKKVTMYDGSVKILVSRWALRYSILEMGKDMFGWRLAQGLAQEKGDHGDFERTGNVVNPSYRKFIKNDKLEKVILDFPEFDLFGFMITKEGNRKKEEEGKSWSRITPVKISHAISLNTYNFDTQFMANLGVSKRAGVSGSNPVNIEEFYGFYIYNITIDLSRIGILDDDPNKKLDDDERNKRISQLIEIIMSLKRDIKGKREDLSPWLVIAGVYSNINYDTYMDKIKLLKTQNTKVTRTEKRSQQEDGREVIEITYYEEIGERPKFKIEDFRRIENAENVFIYKKNSIELEGIESINQNNIFNNKEKFIERLKSVLRIN